MDIIDINMNTFCAIIRMWRIARCISGSTLGDIALVKQYVKCWEKNPMGLTRWLEDNYDEIFIEEFEEIPE